jgi:hypothetical protein
MDVGRQMVSETGDEVWAFLTPFLVLHPYSLEKFVVLPRRFCIEEGLRFATARFGSQM